MNIVSIKQKIINLGKKAKNSNIPIISSSLRGIHHFINEPNEVYWSWVEKRSRRKSSDYKIYKMLDKSYKKVIYSEDYLDRLRRFGIEKKPKKNLDGRIPVFTIWFQGIDTAPEIVRICIDSMYRHFDDKRFNLIVLDDNSIWDYIDFPEFLKKKWDNFGKAHQSDILRLILLYQYGGIWTDATFYFAKPMPDELLKLKLFAFRYGDKTKNNKCPINYIYCTPNDEIIGRTLLGLLSYCDRNRRFKFYLMFNYIFSFAYFANQRTIEEYESMPTRLAGNNFLLQGMLNKLFDECEWEYLTSITFLFKLSHKMELSDSDSTYYAYIKQQYLNRCKSD